MSPGFETSKDGGNGTWRTNVEYGAAWKKRGAWGTPFSAFRFAIPELCGFSGRAVYFDADMQVFADVRELLECSMSSGYRVCHDNRTDVAVIDCGWFADKAWWPRIEAMKPSGWLTFHYTQLLRQHRGLDVTLDPAWNVCDKLLPTRDPGLSGVKLAHFTVVPTQPYHPYPGVRYVPHPWKSWVAAWRAEEEASRAEAS